MRQIIVVLTTLFLVSGASAAEKVTYSQAQAVFARHCLSCHDAKQAEGKLVMESYELLLKGGEDGAAIIPGKADQSPLVRQIEHRAKPFMPPKKAKDTLKAQEIATIRAWIDGGAPAPAPGEAIVPLAPTIIVPKIAPQVAPRKPVRAIAWSAQAKIAAIAHDDEVDLMDVEDRGIVRRLHVEKGNVNALAFSADGLKLAAGAGEPGVAGEINLWNASDGTLIKRFAGHKDAVYSITLSPDGKLLASGSYDNGIILWNIDTGQTLQTLDGHNGAVLGLAFRPDGTVIASASADRTVKLWDVKSGARLDTFAESLKELNTISFTRDGGRVIAAGADNRIRIWQLSPTAKEGTNHLLVAQFGHEGAILRLALSSDGKMLATAADDRTVKLWDPAPTSTSGSPELKLLRVLAAQSDWPAAVAFAAEDKLLVVGRLDGTVGFYDTQTGSEVPPAKPELTSVEPRGIQRGSANRLELKGKHLAGISAVTFGNAKLAAKVVDDEPARADSKRIEVSPAADLAPGAYDVKVSSAGGESGSLRVFVDDLPQLSEKEPNDSIEEATAITFPADVWGKFDRRGDTDYFAFDGKSGQAIVLDVAAQRIGSQAKVLVELLDSTGRLLASSSGFDTDPEPLLAKTLPSDGRYVVRLTELEAAASEAHFYRLSIGNFAYVTGCYPLAVAPSCEGKVRLLGLNMPSDAWAVVKAGVSGEADVPIDAARFRGRRMLRTLIGAGPEPLEAEPNDSPEHANIISVPGSINGRIDHPGDADLFRFEAKSGQDYVIETLASRRGSPVDTRIEILHPDGSPVPRVQLRAVRDSAITFRGFDANAGGGRLLNWEEMDLNQYLYLSGEVARLFLAPRGPDSEYGFFTINGRRRCYFDTTATAHALDEKCYVVEPRKPDEKLSPNGLPVFTINYENDDGAARALGSDSRLLFTAPADGAYLVRVTDARHAGGERYVYRLTVRPAEPDFNASIDLSDPVVPTGAGRSFAVNLDRIDGFDGAVRIDASGAPPGFVISSPIVVEAGHTSAHGTIYAAPEAPAPTSGNDSQTKITATVTVGGKEIVKPVNGFGKIKLAPKPALFVGLAPAGAPASRPASAPETPPEITVVPGQFTPARLWIVRNNFNEEVTFEADNLPHGVIVADIGLNGVLIAEGKSERQIFLHTAPWVADQDRLCYVRALQAGNPTSMPVMIHVRRPIQQAGR